MPRRLPVAALQGTTDKRGRLGQSSLAFWEMRDVEISAEQRKGMRSVLWTQCLTVMAEGTVLNGTMLLYLTAVGVDAARTMAYLAIPPLTAGVLLLPLAYLADRLGKKRIGQIGVGIGILGWATVAAGPSIGGGRAEAVVVGGLVLAAVCTAMVTAGWFSLLSPIVPREIRGRFFSRLRMSFSLVMVSLAAIYAWVLARNSGIEVYQGIFAIAALAFVARWFF
jgi:MFS family permease